MIRTRTILVDGDFSAKAWRNLAGRMTGRMVRPDTTVVDREDGSPILMHLQLDPAHLRAFRAAAELVEMSQGKRSQGQWSMSRVFGWAPRMAPYQIFGCRRPTVYDDHPEAARRLDEFTRTVSEAFWRYAPEVAERQRQQMEGVLPYYRLPGQLFTSGIVNRSWALRYHHDRLNFAGSWSAMVVLRRATTGGHLDIPQLGMTLECPDASLLLFDGQRFMHGVTPMSIDDRRGYRISVVWYARRDMCACLDPEAEAAQAAVRETVSAEGKAALDRGERTRTW